MDWLLSRQRAIEGKLAGRHLGEGGLVLYDVSSSYYEGRTCPLARYGHNRDGKKGRPIIPLLADQRRQRREELLAATQRDLKRLAVEVARRTKKPLGKAEIALKAGKISGRYKMAKHFELAIEEGVFQYRRNETSIERERQLDGIYVVRTGEPAKRLSVEDAVRN